jgi:hypothetical protein
MPRQYRNTNQKNGLCEKGENVVVYFGQSVIPREHRPDEYDSMDIQGEA